jgi:23S rRNA pseudoU1915 N3-methylase RlmH
MTFDEAQTKHNQLKSLYGAMRLLLLEMRDRKGWLALGFENWEQYGEQEWGFTRQHLNRLATSAYIQNLVEPIGSEEIPESHLRPLTSVPDDAKIEIWQQVKSEHEKITGKVVQDAVNDWKAKNEIIVPKNKVQQIHSEEKTAEFISTEEWGNLVLGCSQAIATEQKKTSETKYALKKLAVQHQLAQMLMAVMMSILVD